MAVLVLFIVLFGATAEQAMLHRAKSLGSHDLTVWGYLHSHPLLTTKDPEYWEFRSHTGNLDKELTESFRHSASLTDLEYIALHVLAIDCVTNKVAVAEGIADSLSHTPELDRQLLALDTLRRLGATSPKILESLRTLRNKTPSTFGDYLDETISRLTR